MHYTPWHALLSQSEKVCAEYGYSVSVKVRPSPESLLLPPARRDRAAALPLVRRAAAVTLFAVMFLLELSVSQSALLAASSSGGNAGSIGQVTDPLVKRLVSTPLPKNSYQGWNLTDKPEISEDKQPDEGQVAKVMASITRASGRDLGGFVFTVFKAPAQARNSHEETIKSDRAHGGNVITPSGITGACWGTGGKVTVCRALVGRTLVSALFTSGESEQTAIASTRSLVEHVSALEK